MMSKYVALDYVEYISKDKFKEIFDNMSWSILTKLDVDLVEDYLTHDTSLFTDVYRFLVKNGVRDMAKCEEEERYIMNICGRVIGRKYDSEDGGALMTILNRSTTYGNSGLLSMELSQQYKHRVEAIL